MKTKSIYFAALLVIVAAVTAIGKDEPTLGMAILSANGSDVVRVIYKGETAGKVKINIYDASSKLVFTENRNSVEGFILPLNFSGLQFGKYKIELTDASGTKAETVDYQPAKSLNNIHVTKLSESGKFLLSVAKAGNEDITIRIFDEFNNLVHDSNKQISDDFAQVFAIKNFKGACRFEVTNGKGQTTVARF